MNRPWCTCLIVVNVEKGEMSERAPPPRSQYVAGSGSGAGRAPSSASLAVESQIRPADDGGLDRDISDDSAIAATQTKGDANLD